MSVEEPAPPEISRDQMLKDLQSWWEIPSIAQYISLFRESFSLPEIEIEELENGLIDDTTNGPSEWISELLLSFLKSQMPGRINKDNWEEQLQKLVTRRCEAGKETPFPAETPFSKLSLRAKVEIIYSLCLYRLDRSDITEVMKSMDADALRVQKLGFDDAGSTYWYFYGTRLYKEESVKKDKSWAEEWKDQKTETLEKRGRGRPRKVKTPITPGRGRGRPRKLNTKMNSDGESEDFDDVDVRNDKYMNVDGKSRWSVVCDTIEEWVNFAEKFKESKSKNEKALFQIVQENFLPVLNKIYEEKEKKFQQKLKELMPVREKIVTRRETRKMRGDIFESSEVNDYASSDNSYSYKTHTSNSRAQRLEERNRRVSEAMLAEINKFKRRRHSESFETSSSEIDQSQEDDVSDNFTVTSKKDNEELDLQSQIEKLMSTIKLHKDAWPFLYPVNEDDAPYYYDIIKDPIDLSTIDKKLREGAYDTVGDLDQAFSLMVSNCKLYNGENNEFSKMVQTLWKMFQKGISNILDSFIPEETSNDASENSSSSDQMYQSPPVRSSKKHKKEKQKSKKRTGMEALEMLAQASEIAVQTSNSNEMRDNLSNYGGHQKAEFSDLKVSSINSHPPSLIERFSSESSNDCEDQQNSLHSSNQSLEASDNSTQYARESQVEVPALVSNESTNYINNNLAHFTNLIEKHNINSLKNLSNNDLTHVLSDGNTYESNRSPVGQHVEFPNEEQNIENLNQGFQMLNDYNENVSSILSQIVKQPTYNNDNSSVTQTNIVNESAYIDDNSSTNNATVPRKSPIMSTSNFSGQTESQTSPLMQNINIQTDLGSPSDNLITVDASAIGLSSSTLPKRPIVSTVPVVISQSHYMANQSHPITAPPANHESALPKPSPTYQSSSPTFQSNSPTFQSNSPVYQINNSSLYQQNLQMPSNEHVNNQFYTSGYVNAQPNHVPVTYQSMNFNLPSTVSTTQATNNQASFEQPVVSSSSGIPALYSQPLDQQVQQQPTIQFLPQSSLMRLSIPPTGGQIKLVSEASTTGPGITYHVYAQSKMDNTLVEEHVNYVPVSQGSSIGVHVSPKTNKRKANKQNTTASRTTPPQQITQATHQYLTKSPQRTTIDRQHLPPLTASASIVRTSLPVTSSNFIPVSPQATSRTRPFIIRPLKQVTSSNSPQKTAAQTKNCPYGFGSKKVPIVFTGYNPPTSIIRNEVQMKPNQDAMMVQQNMVKPNQDAIMVQQNIVKPNQEPMIVQPNMVVSDSNGMVQQMLFSPDQQPIQLSNGQFVFASPQDNATNTAMFSNNQNQQLRNNNVNQSFAKVVPHVISQAPMIQVSKDALQGIQYQTVLQNNQQSYQQVAQNPQYVNIPTYMITNQNQVPASLPQNVISLQQYQMAQRRQMQMNGQGNGS